MKSFGKISLLVVLAVGVAAGIVAGLSINQPAAAQRGGPAGTGSHSVVMTDGTHLIVTDNKTDTLYFYSIEKDAEIGSDLKLRGSLDMSQVGKDTLVPKIFFKKKKD